MDNVLIQRATDETNPLVPHPVELAILGVLVLMAAVIVVLVVWLVRRSNGGRGSDQGTGQPTGQPGAPRR